MPPTACIPDPQNPDTNLRVEPGRLPDHGRATVEPNRLDHMGSLIGEVRYSSWEDRESDQDYRQRLLRTIQARPREYQYGAGGSASWFERGQVDRMHREIRDLETELQEHIFHEWRDVIREAPPPPEPPRLSLWAAILEDDQ